jgi:hypothetical protein
MIARIWHGAVPLAKSEVYLDRMRNVALPDYKSTSGNRGLLSAPWKATLRISIC